ncbi:MAG TPA: YkgJ family cysteine cluster protein [Dehalococcoidales bacterium]|nr:YkgJ family cysteine cluster protein [Dehalococcoidales bacterium]
METLDEITREIYARFEEDVRRLHAIEPLWQPCTNCSDGYCCKNETVPVMQHEWERIVKFVRSEMPENQKRRLQTNVDRGRPKCPFLMRERCSVYPVRAWTCRIYPYTISQHRANHPGKFIAPFCPAYAQVFGSKEHDLAAYQPEIVQKLTDCPLVEIRIKDNLKFWVIDISFYAAEIWAALPRNDKGVMDGDDMHNWMGVVKYLRDSRRIDHSRFLNLLGLD